MAGGGVPTLAGGGVPTLAGGGVPTLAGGVPTLAGGVPTLAGGYLPWPGGYLPWPGGTYLGQGVPTLARGYLPWLGWGTPPWCEQTENITSRRIRYAGANKRYIDSLNRKTSFDNGILNSSKVTSRKAEIFKEGTI